MSDVKVASTPMTNIDEIRSSDFRVVLNFITSHVGNVFEDDEKPYNTHSLAAPLIQVFSVRLDSYLKDKRACIYGKINVIEDSPSGTTFTLYDRPKHSPEVLQKKGALLSLTGPFHGESHSFGAISRSRGATMQLALRDSVSDLEVRTS